MTTCKAKEWCGLPYREQKVPSRVAWPSMSFVGALASSFQPAYCSPSCRDAAAVPKMPALDDRAAWERYLPKSGLPKSDGKKFQVGQIWAEHIGGIVTASVFRIEAVHGDERVDIRELAGRIYSPMYVNSPAAECCVLIFHPDGTPAAEAPKVAEPKYPMRSGPDIKPAEGMVVRWTRYSTGGSTGETEYAVTVPSGSGRKEGGVDPGLWGKGCYDILSYPSVPGGAGQGPTSAPQSAPTKPTNTCRRCSTSIPTTMAVCVPCEVEIIDRAKDTKTEHQVGIYLDNIAARAERNNLMAIGYDGPRTASCNINRSLPQTTGRQVLGDDPRFGGRR